MQKNAGRSCTYRFFFVILQPFMRRLGIIVLLVSLSVGTLWADDAKKPSFQLEDNTFFDPTKKQEQEVYQFGMDNRLEVGYVQHQQRARDISFSDLYLHGVRLGWTIDFRLPLHFSIQTGLIYTLLYGKGEQHWRSQDAQTVQKEYITHHVMEHNLTIPVRAYYTIPLWRELNLFFYAGPQLHIGLAEPDYLKTHLSDGTKTWLEKQGVQTSPYDRYNDELIRANIQFGLGGGLEWAQYRLQSGYDFGLNNMIHHKQLSNQYMAEWGWFVSFCYKF